MSRDYRFLPEAGITLAVDVNNDRARVALAACSTEDTYSKETGRTIVNTLLDSNNTTLQALNLSRNVVCFPYTKGKPRNHILKPLLNFLADELSERIFFRQLHSFFMQGITTKAIASKVAQQQKREDIYFNFKKLTELMDETSLALLDELSDEQEFYLNLFDWRGSVDCIMSRLRKFASAVHTGKIVLQDEENREPKRVAPRKPNPTPSSISEKPTLIKPEGSRAVAASALKEDKSE